jgi:hypothetical protein
LTFFFYLVIMTRKTKCSFHTRERPVLSPSLEAANWTPVPQVAPVLSLPASTGPLHAVAKALALEVASSSPPTAPELTRSVQPSLPAPVLCRRPDRARVARSVCFSGSSTPSSTLSPPSTLLSPSHTLSLSDSSSSSGALSTSVPLLVLLLVLFGFRSGVFTFREGERKEARRPFRSHSSVKITTSFFFSKARAFFLRDACARALRAAVQHSGT